MANINQEPIDNNGKEHGQWIRYYYNGQIMYRWNFVHGIEHGLFQGYTFDGRECYRENYDMGTKKGYWFFGNANFYHLCLI